MIAQFKQMTRWSTAAAGLLIVLGTLTLTDADSAHQNQATCNHGNRAT